MTISGSEIKLHSSFVKIYLRKVTNPLETVLRIDVLQWTYNAIIGN